MNTWKWDIHSLARTESLKNVSWSARMARREETGEGFILLLGDFVVHLLRTTLTPTFSIAKGGVVHLFFKQM